MSLNYNDFCTVTNASDDIEEIIGYTKNELIG